MAPKYWGPYFSPSAPTFFSFRKQSRVHFCSISTDYRVVIRPLCNGKKELRSSLMKYFADSLKVYFSNCHTEKSTDRASGAPQTAVKNFAPSQNLKYKN